jgi:hypothetical protein
LAFCSVSRPGLLEIADGITVSVEHQHSNANIAVLLEQPRPPATVYQLDQITFEHDGAASARFSCFRSESNRAGIAVNVAPFEGDDLALRPSREVGEPGEVPQVVGQGGNHSLQVGPFEETLPGERAGDGRP